MKRITTTYQALQLIHCLITYRPDFAIELEWIANCATKSFRSPKSDVVIVIFNETRGKLTPSDSFLGPLLENPDLLSHVKIVVVAESKPIITGVDAISNSPHCSVVLVATGISLSCHVERIDVVSQFHCHSVVSLYIH